MYKIRLVKWVIFALLSPVVLLEMDGPEAAEPLEYFVSGVVRDDENSAVKGAIVRTEHLETGIATIGLTDAAGTFRIPLPKTGEYDVSVTKKGYRPGPPKTFNVNGPLKSITLELTYLPAPPLHQLTSADIIAHLPEAPEKMIFVDSCVACHSLGRILQRGRTRNEWSQVLQRMRTIPGGYIRINDENSPSIMSYLTKYFGSDSELPQLLGKRVKQAYREELPIGHDVIYREYEIPTPVALPHTAVPDRRGSVWFAEFGGGKVGRLEISTGKITEYIPKTPNVHPHGITVSPEGIIWYTAFPYGIGRIDPETGEMEEFKVPDSESGEPVGAHTIIVARSGKIWFSEIIGGGIGSFDPETKVFERHMIEEGSAPYGILEREDNVFWFCLLRASKIGVLDANTGEVKLFPVPTKNSEPQRLRFDAKGRLWFGEYDSGKLGMFNPMNEQFTEYDLPFRGSAYSLHIDQRGYVWVASFERDSLIRFNPENEEMIEYPLPGVGAIVRDIWPDEQGRMWFVQWGRNKVTSAEHIPGLAAK